MNSLWIEDTKEKAKFPTLEKNEETTVCIIGAGIFGLTTAYYLAKKGIKTIVIERDEIGEKVSGNTTGKITSQHGLFYDYLINSYGVEYAKKYFESNEKAIQNIKKIIEDEKIKCDFEIKDSFVYTTNQDEVQKIEKEKEAMDKIGYNAEIVTKTSLPFKITRAIKFKNQAQFHPREYMLGLCKAILENRGKIYTNSRVTDIKEEGSIYETHVGNLKVKSKYVVLATHYPIKDMPGFYFTKMYQSTSYVIAIKTKEAKLDGMYINEMQPVYSFRTAKYNGEDIILIAGSDHKTGDAIANDENYKNLENKAKQLYPDAEILFKWNTRDCISLDKVPYIGEFSNLMKNIYVGTGFKKWGMTLSNVAANIVVDKILGKENEYENIYNSTRMQPIKNIEEVKNMAKQTVNSIALNKLKIEKENLDKIENNNGAIIKINEQNVGIYKDEDGKVYAVKPNCAHLGCLLSWNNIDKTWDCPCHGSRFDFMGNNIYEPATLNLDVIKIEE